MKEKEKQLFYCTPSRLLIRILCISKSKCQLHMKLILYLAVSKNETFWYVICHSPEYFSTFREVTYINVNLQTFWISPTSQLAFRPSWSFLQIDGRYREAKLILISCRICNKMPPFGGSGNQYFEFRDLENEQTKMRWRKSLKVTNFRKSSDFKTYKESAWGRQFLFRMILPNNHHSWYNKNFFQRYKNNGKFLSAIVPEVWNRSQVTPTDM